jgi:hypothetical protein
VGKNMQQETARRCIMIVGGGREEGEDREEGEVGRKGR